MSEQSSVDSDLSDDAFVNQISQQWGGEESELRQALFFQFIKTGQFNDLVDSVSVVNDLDNEPSENGYDFTMNRTSRQLHEKANNERSVSTGVIEEYEHSGEKRLTINQSSRNMFATEENADVGRLSSHISRPLTNLDDDIDEEDEKSDHLTSSVIS